jgi:prepilin-type N-terminal cleavage/methylation domain-containing protein
MKTLSSCSNLRQQTLFLRQGAADGYTLVEILIVVAVIGLLLAIAGPNYIKHRSAVRVKSCMENLRVLDAAKAQWAVETRQGTAARPGTNDVIPYLRDGKLPECPAKGTYRLRSLSRAPNCSLWPEGHTLANINGDDDPDAD